MSSVTSGRTLPPRGSPWTPLREPVFRALWTAAIVSYIGTWVQNVGTGWLMASLTSSSLLVAMVQVAMSLPVFFIALPAGAIADIVDRRRFLLVTQSLMTLAAAALGLLTLRYAVTPSILLLFTFLLGAGAALNDPAWQALTPDLVSHHEVPKAVGLNSAAFNMARAVGPALGGLIIAAVGAGPAFLLNSISFLGVIYFLYRWKPGPRPMMETRLFSAIRVGIEYARSVKEIRSVLLRTGFFAVPASAFWALLPRIAQPHGPVGYGTVLAGFGAGALCGAALLPRLRDRRSLDAIVFVASGLFAVALALLPASSSLGGLTMAAFLAGFGWITVLATLNTFTQTCSPSWVRGRTLSLYVLVLQGGLALGSVLWGSIASLSGVSVALPVAGLTMIAGLVVTPVCRLRVRPAETLTIGPDLQ